MNISRFASLLRKKPGLVITAVSAAAAFLFWVGDASIDAFLFHRGAFADLLMFGLTPYEWYFRIIILTCLFLSGLLITRIVLKRNLALDALREGVDTLHTITGAAKDAIVMVDHRGCISFWNTAAERIFGYTAGEAIGRDLHMLLSPSRYHEAYRQGFDRFLISGEGPTIGRTLELTAKSKEGVEFPVELSLSALQRGNIWCAIGILRDISARKRTETELEAHRERLEHLVAERTEGLNAVNELLRKEIADRTRTEEELYRSETFLSTIFDSFRDPFSIVDRGYRLVRFNDAFLRSKNRRASDIFGRKCHAVLHDRPAVCDDCIVEKTFQSKDPCAKEKCLPLPDGSPGWVEIYTYPIFDQDGDVAHVVVYTRDITARKKEEAEKKDMIEKLNYLSTTDVLTGLYNRRALNDMLQREIDRAVRHGSDLSLVLCDVDRFKQINDTFGHSAGDLALQAVSEALRNTLRKSDILGRYGGDEFMIILPETDVAGARNLAEKLRSTVEELDLDVPGGRKVRPSISIGVAPCCASSDTIDTVVTFADSALYASKEGGRNRVTVVDRV